MKRRYLVPVVLAGAALAADGRRAEAAPTLEGMLERALSANPDLLVAKADVRYAEAELRKIRLAVSQAAVTAYHVRQAARQMVEVGEQHYTLANERYRAGQTDQTEVFEALRALEEGRGKLLAAVADLRLLGGAEGEWKPVPSDLKALLERALAGSPDIELAERGLERAKVGLNRLRLDVAKKVTMHHYQRSTQELLVKCAKEEFQRTRELVAREAISDSEVSVKLRALAEAEAKLALLNAEIDYLLGAEIALEKGKKKQLEEGGTPPRAP